MILILADIYFAHINKDNFFPAMKYSDMTIMLQLTGIALNWLLAHRSDY